MQHFAADAMRMYVMESDQNTPDRRGGPLGGHLAVMASVKKGYISSSTRDRCSCCAEQVLTQGHTLLVWDCFVLKDISVPDKYGYALCLRSCSAHEGHLPGLLISKPRPGHRTEYSWTGAHLAGVAHPRATCQISMASKVMIQ